MNLKDEKYKKTTLNSKAKHNSLGLMLAFLHKQQGLIMYGHRYRHDRDT